MSSDLPEPSPNPSSGDPFSDIPLFREIQRVLMSSSGPVQLTILATRIASTASLPRARKRTSV